MTGSTWQTAIVILLLAGAVAYLLQYAIRRRRAKSACAHCPAVNASRRRH